MLQGLSQTALWLIIAVVLGVIEAVTLGVVTIWFALGALVAMVSAALGVSTKFQIAIFLISSGVLLYFTRPFVKNYFKIGTVRTNADRLVGEKGIVIEKIDVVNGKGQVKVGGQVWSARSLDNQDISVNESVEVQDISGVKLIVKKLENKKGEL